MKWTQINTNAKFETRIHYDNKTDTKKIIHTHITQEKE